MSEEDLMPAWHREALEAEGWTDIGYIIDGHFRGQWFGVRAGADRQAPVPPPNDWRETGRRIDAIEAADSNVEIVRSQKGICCVVARGPDRYVEGWGGTWHEVVARAYVEAVRWGWLGGTKHGYAHSADADIYTRRMG